MLSCRPAPKPSVCRPNYPLKPSTIAAIIAAIIVIIIVIIIDIIKNNINNFIIFIIYTIMIAWQLLPTPRQSK